MFKLLSRFASIIAITIGIAIIAINSNFYISGIIVAIIVKYVLLSDNFIKSRLDFFANSIKENYLLDKEKKFTKEDKTKKDNFKSIEDSNQEIINFNKVENTKEFFLDSSIKKENIENITKDKIINLQRIDNTQKNSLNSSIKEEKINKEKNFYHTNYDSKNSNFQNSKNYGPDYKTKSIFEIFFTKIGSYIKDFFSTNLLAKLGGILVFLASIYFLKGAIGFFWDLIGPAGRIFLGFLLAIGVYITGTRIFIKYEKEALVLMGTGILINFAVILAGRYLVGGNGYLTETTTFIFLILNTIFGISTSIYYNSKIILIFSFIFAYLNPFLIGAKGNGEPYTLVLYSSIISISGLFLSLKRANLVLLGISFILGNLLFLIAPFSKDIGWITKFLSTTIFNIFTIVLINKFKSISHKTKKIAKILFILSYIFLFIQNLSFGGNISETITLLILFIFSFIFFFFTYFYSKKQSIPSLYSIGTIGIITLILPFIFNKILINTLELKGSLNNTKLELSILFTIVFGISNLIFPFINKNLLNKKNIVSLIIGIFVGVIFLVFQIFNFGEIYFSGLKNNIIILGLLLLGLSIIYFIEGFFIGKTIGFKKIKNDNKLQNLFYSFITLAISILSISIAFIFYKKPDIIAMSWMIETTILYSFYSKTNNVKIFSGATILFIIGFFKLLEINNNLSISSNFILIFIFSLSIYNLYLINKQKQNNYNNIHYLVHIILIGITLMILIDNTGSYISYNLLIISVLVTIIGYFYNKFNILFLKIFFATILGVLSLFHIFELIFNLENFRLINYIISIIIISNYFIWKKVEPKADNYGKILLIIVGFYTFIISNIYILDLFGKFFGYYTLTIYWGLIASILLIYGIQKNIIKYRTIGLYFLVLTSIKIFLSDVWQISNTDARWGVFLILGIIFIFISTLYTKKFGDNLTKEFDFANLTDKKLNNLEEKKSNILNLNKKHKFLINKKIKDIDISNYKGVKFIYNDGKVILINSKNLIKISKLIIDNLLGKTKFAPKELEKIYVFIKNNYKTELSEENYKKILNILDNFIEFGGEVKLMKKNNYNN